MEQIAGAKRAEVSATWGVAACRNATRDGLPSASARILAATLLMLTAPMIALAAIVLTIRIGAPALVWHLQHRGDATYRGYRLQVLLAPLSAAGKPLTVAQRQTALGLAIRALYVDRLPTLAAVVMGHMTLSAWFDLP